MPAKIGTGRPEHPNLREAIAAWLSLPNGLKRDALITTNENGEARYQGWEIYRLWGHWDSLVTQEAPPMLSAQFLGQGSLAMVVRGLANGVCRHDRHDRHNSHKSLVIAAPLTIERVQVDRVRSLSILRLHDGIVELRGPIGSPSSLASFQS